MEFSVRLKELRVDNDMSQTELAEKLEQMAQENNLERFFTSALGTTTTGQ